MLAKLTKSLAPSAIMALDARVKDMQAKGIQIVNLCVGEPDFDTPKHIQEAAFNAIKQGFTHYTPSAGLIELRIAITDKFKKENHISYDASEVMIGPGSKPLLYLAFRVLLDREDEVIIPTPAWNSFVEQVKICGGKPVLIPLKPPFKVAAKDIKKYITKRTKVILINNPSNPTGAIVERKELEAIADLAVEHNIYVIADEIYEKLIYSGKHTSIASLNKRIQDRTITMNGLSKSYAMTGWRIGYAGGPKDVIAAMIALESQVNSCVAAFTQKAAFAALTNDQQPVKKMVGEFTKRRNLIASRLGSVKGMTVTEPEGAFYMYVGIERLLGKQYKTSLEWCEALLEEAHVAVVPGEAFFYPGYFRLSFAASMENLKSAAKKISKFVLQ